MASSIYYGRKSFRKSNISYLPDTHTYSCALGSKKCCFFGMFCVHTKWNVYDPSMVDKYLFKANNYNTKHELVNF